MTEYLACPGYYRRRQQSDLWLEPEPAAVYAQPRSPSVSFEGDCQGSHCACAAVSGAGGAVLFYNCEGWEEISGCLANQTTLQMSALCMHPQGWACFELMMKTGCSDLTWEGDNEQVPFWDMNHSGALRGELCLPSWLKGLCSDSSPRRLWWGNFAFCKRGFCFLQGRRGGHLQ